MSDVPLWDIALDCGAARADLDLTALKVREVRIEAGASTVHLRLGANVPEARVRIEAGVSAFRLEVPESAGCEIRVDAPLASKHFNGFRKEKSGLYLTDNFETAGKRILIDIDAGVTSLRINRYPG